MRPADFYPLLLNSDSANILASSDTNSWQFHLHMQVGTKVTSMIYLQIILL